MGENGNIFYSMLHTGCTCEDFVMSSCTKEYVAALPMRYNFTSFGVN